MRCHPGSRKGIFGLQFCAAGCWPGGRSTARRCRRRSRAGSVTSTDGINLLRVDEKYDTAGGTLDANDPWRDGGGEHAPSGAVGEPARQAVLRPFETTTPRRTTPTTTLRATTVWVTWCSSTKGAKAARRLSTSPKTPSATKLSLATSTATPGPRREPLGSPSTNRQVAGPVHRGCITSTRGGMTAKWGGGESFGIPFT